MHEQIGSTPEIKGDLEKPSEEIRAVLAGSETFTNFHSHGMKPPNVRNWQKVLNELGQAVFEGIKDELKAYAEATKDSNLATAMRDVRFVVTEDVSELDYDSAKEKLKTLINERLELEEQVSSDQQKLAKHIKAHKTDPGHAIYIDEFEGKIASAKNRIQYIYDLLDKLEEEFGLTEEDAD